MGQRATGQRMVCKMLPYNVTLTPINPWDYCHRIRRLRFHLLDEKILYLTPEQEKDKSHFTDKEVSAAYIWVRYKVLHVVRFLNAFFYLSFFFYIDWTGTRADREHAIAGVVCKQLQEVWSNAGNRNRQESGRVPVCEGLWRHRGSVFWCFHNKIL